MNASVTVFEQHTHEGCFQCSKKESKPWKGRFIAIPAKN